MTRMVLPILAIVVILAAGTYYQGTYSERWGRRNSDLLNKFSERLANVPLAFGEWEGNDQEYDEEQFKLSNCDGCVSRLYTSKRTNETVSVYLVSGTARNITIHTPNWCYVGAGFDMESQPQKYDIECSDNNPDNNPSAEFITTTFLRNTLQVTEHLRIFWTFSDNSNWFGPTGAKMHFAGRPALFKLYLITPIMDPKETPEDSPSKRFAEEFMPILNDVLFVDSSAVTETNKTDTASAQSSS